MRRESKVIDAQGKLFGRVNVLDLLLLVVVFVSALGVVLARTGNAGVNQVLKGEGTAEIDLFFRGSIADPSMFKVGDKTFITIRNQPHASLKIVGVKVTPKLITMPAPGGVKAYPDPSEPFGKDVVLTVREKAQFTDDAVIMGGQKIKVGVPIEVEGFKYRLRGSIVDVRVVEQPKL
jgi:hypothetical protein